jgi:hypothetical protein
MRYVLAALTFVVVFILLAIAMAILFVIGLIAAILFSKSFAAGVLWLTICLLIATIVTLEWIMNRKETTIPVDHEE